MGRVPVLQVREMYLPGDRGERAATRVCIETNRRHMGIRTSGGCDMMAVYLDGMRISDPGTALLSLSPHSVESVEVLTPQQAVVRYGTLAANGVLEIYTRGGGPHARHPGQ